MAQTCLPDELWSDPRGQYLMKRKRRLWILLCNIHRLGSRYPVLLTQPNLPIGVWTVNLDLRSDKQLEKDIAELRAMGVLAADALRIEFSPIEEGQAIVASASRPRYPSDERRKTQSNGHLAPTPQETPQPAPAEPADTPQTLWTDSATEPPGTPHPSRTRACPDPDPESGTDVIYKNSGIRNPDPEGQPRRPTLTPPPLCVVECLVELGMERVKAEARLVEFGEARCRDALDSLALLPTAPHKPAAWVVDFLLKKKPLPASVVKARERAAQQGMTLLSSVQGGMASSQDAHGSPGQSATHCQGLTEATAILQRVADSPPALQAAQWRPDPGVDPPKQMLSSARKALKRAGGGKP